MSSGIGAGVAGIVGGIGGIIGGEQAESEARSSAEWMGAQTQRAAAMADPFAPERQQYAGMLKNLLTDPASLLESPLYKSTVEAGSSNVERTMASRGLRMSGAEKVALSDVAGSSLENLYFQLANQYAQFSGANVNPAQAASLLVQGTTSAESMRLGGASRSAQMMGQGIGSLISGGVDLYKSFGGGGAVQPSTAGYNYTMAGGRGLNLENPVGV